MDNADNLKITVPENATEINLVLELSKNIPAEREITANPVFSDNKTAMNFNEEMSFILPQIRSFSLRPNALISACVSYYDTDFAKNTIEELIDGGFTDNDAFPFFDCGKPRVSRDPLLLTLSVLTYTAVSNDYRFFDDEAVLRHIRKRLAAPPDNLPQAAALFFANEKAHDLLGDRLFTVQNVTGLKTLVSGSGFFTEWFRADTDEKILELCRRAKLPRAFALLTVLEKIYGIRIQNGCIGVCPAGFSLPSLSVSVCGKKISVNYVQGYPRKTFLGNAAYEGNLKISDLQQDYAVLTVCG